MGKRKTCISIDAWLNKRLSPLTTDTASTLAIVDCEAPNQISTAEEVHTELNVTVVIGGLIDATSEVSLSANILPVYMALQPVPRVVISEPAAGARERPQPVNEVTDDVARNEGENA